MDFAKVINRKWLSGKKKHQKLFCQICYFGVSRFLWFSDQSFDNFFEEETQRTIVSKSYKKCALIENSHFY